MSEAAAAVDAAGLAPVDVAGVAAVETYWSCCGGCGWCRPGECA